MSGTTEGATLAAIETGRDVVEYLLAADGLGYGTLVESTVVPEAPEDDWDEAHLRDGAGNGVVRYVELAAGGGAGFDGLTDHLKRHGSPTDELLTVVARRRADEGHLDSPLADELTVLTADERAAAAAGAAFDLTYATVDRTDVAPVYRDLLDGLAATPGQSRAALGRSVGETLSLEAFTRSFHEQFGRLFREELRPAVRGLEDAEADPNAYTRRVVNRVLFLLFVEEKGWLDGNTEYVEEAYERAAARDDLHVYHDVFEPLFFEALADPDRQDYGDLGRLPFLGGGLFDRRPADAGVTIDEAFFDALLAPGTDAGDERGFLRRYEFSLRESPPSERELVVDPGVLGRVFEMVMQAEERAEVGAFYTPRPLTTYMARNALRHHLLDAVETLARDEATALVAEHRVPDTLDGAAVEGALAALETVTVLDPAVGSGAFVVAVLEELVGVAGALAAAAGSPRDRFDLKREFVARSVYGVDVDPGGVELCKFRAWLSLVRELDLDHEAFLAATRCALPDLGSSFFVGNSLVGEHAPIRLDGDREPLPEGVDAAVDELREARAAALRAHGDRGKAHTDRLESLRARLERHLATGDHEWMDGVAAEADRPFSWHRNVPAVVLDGGFDIVIGNPPYEGASQQGYVGALARFYADRYGFYTTVPGMRHDLYQKFVVRGWELVRDGGVLSYVTSDTFLTIGSKRATRNLLQENRLQELLLANPDTFEATVNPAVFTLRKGPPAPDHAFVYADASETPVGQYRSLVGRLAPGDPGADRAPADGGGGVADLDLPGPTRGYVAPAGLYRDVPRRAFFEPTPLNRRLARTVLADVTDLAGAWGDELRSPSPTDRAGEAHVDDLDPGDVSLLGLVTAGGVGLHTGNNDRYLAYLDGTRGAERVKARNDDFRYVERNEEQYRWMSRVIRPEHVADVDALTAEERRRGIEGRAATWVPVVKGKGDPYYTEPTEYIDWSREAVEGMRRDGSLRNVAYYFREGVFAVGQGTGDPQFRYTDGAVVEHSGNILVPVTDRVSTEYLLGVLNSAFATYLVGEFLNHTVNTQLSDVRRLPVVVPTADQRARVEELVAEAIDCQRGGADADLADLQARVDAAVAEIYGVPEFAAGTPDGTA